MATFLEYKTTLDNSSFQRGMKENLKTTSLLDKGMSSLGSTIVGALSVGAVVSFGKAVIDSLANYQKFHASLKTLLQGNVEMTNALETQLVNLAKSTPFSLTDVQEGTTKLLAYGFQAGKITEELTRIGNVAAGVGAPLNDIIYLYGTLRTQGIAYTKDINQFTGRGIPITRELAKQLGVTEDKIKSLAEKGKIGFKDIEKAFKSMTAEGGQFFNMMEEQSKTVGGQISALGDSWEQLQVNIGKSQTGIIASTVNFFNDFVSSLNKGVEAMNLMSESFKNFGAKEYSFIEKYGLGTRDKVRGLFGLAPTEGGFAEMQQYAADMKANLVKPGEDKLGILKNMQSLKQIIANISRDTSMATVEKDRRISILETLYRENLGLLKLKESAKEDKTKAGKEDKDKPDKKAQARENITINIDSIGKQMTINSYGAKESAEEIRAIVLDSLQSAVFGAKYAGR